MDGAPPDGQSDCVLFVHGWAESRHTWDKVVGLLDSRIEIVALDLPGHGDSGVVLPSRQEALEFATISLKAVIQDLKARHRHLLVVGHSMGGLIALLAIAELSNGARPDGLLLIAPMAPDLKEIPFAARAFAHVPKWLVKLGAGIGLAKPLLIKNLKRCVCDPTCLPESYIKHLVGSHASARGMDVLSSYVESARRLRGRAQALSGDITNARLGKVRILWGDDDQLLPPATAAFFQQAMPESVVISVKAAGHILQMDQPGIVADHVLKLVDFWNRD